MEGSKGLEKTATVVAIVVGISQLFGFFLAMENHLKILLLVLFMINILFIVMLIKVRRDMRAKTIKYKKELSKLDLELYDIGIKLENNTKKAIKKSPDLARESLESGMVEYVSKLSEILTLHSGEEVNVTLRALKEDNIKRVGDCTVVPIALSNSINTTRKRVFNAGKAANGRIVKNNTDFQFIIDDRITTYFYAKDVTKIPNYQNENLQYAEFYKGKIVLPINYYGDDAKEYGYYHTVGNIPFSTLGFIIADTPKDKLFTDERRDYYLNLLELYAKRSSTLLYQYKYCIRKIEKERENSLNN